MSDEIEEKLKVLVVDSSNIERLEDSVEGSSNEEVSIEKKDEKSSPCDTPPLEVEDAPKEREDQSSQPESIPPAMAQPLSVDELDFFSGNGSSKMPQLPPQTVDVIDTVNEEKDECTKTEENPPIPSSSTSLPSPSVAVAPVEQETLTFALKQVEYGDKIMRIMTQNANGACPLISIVNALVLQGRISLFPLGEDCSHNVSHFLTIVGNLILSELENGHSMRNSEQQNANTEANVSSALKALEKAVYGLDVNPRFTDINDFEFTEELALFDILKLNLYHGWIPEEEETKRIIGKRGYNEIVALSTDENHEESVILKYFLDSTMSQLTNEGVIRLNLKMNQGDVAILFRNNHFQTIVKNKNTLYFLATDQGLLEYQNLVFESLVDVSQGQARFTDGKFRTFSYDATRPRTTERGGSSHGILVDPPVMSEQESKDLAYAKALQREENEMMAMHRRQERQEEQLQQQQREVQRVQQERMEEQRRKEKDKKCNIS